jgi:WD40 repeat protein
MMNALVFSADGKRLAAGGHEVRRDPPKGKILVYDTATWEKAADISAHQQEVMRLRFSPDGKLLASGSRDGSVKLWEVGGWKLRGEMTDHKKPISVIDFSPDSQRLATLGFEDLRITPVSKPPFSPASTK